MLDNGAYSLWKLNRAAYTYTRDAFYEWARPWLDYRTTWLVIPDVIGGTEEENDRLVEKSVKYFRSNLSQIVPVWHMHESILRLWRLITKFDRVCFGSSGEYQTIGSNAWNQRMNFVFNAICGGSGAPPAAIHMLRGMSLSGSIYPFASVDSTDVARNHNRPQNTAREMADLWDAQQCPAVWSELPIQQDLLEVR